MAMLGEAAGIGQEVEQNLLDARAVYVDAGKIRWQGEFETDLLAIQEQLGDHAHRFLDQSCEVHVLAADGHLQGLRPGQVEDVVHYCPQVAGALRNFADILAQLRRPLHVAIGLRVALHDLDETEDDVKGRAQLVADRGGELLLQLAGLACLALRYGELREAALEQAVCDLQRAVELVHLLLAQAQLTGQVSKLFFAHPGPRQH
jgi:hypothetical protein